MSADAGFLSIGECMIEFYRRDDNLWGQGFAGDTLNVAWAVRALAPDWPVRYLTRVGADAMSDQCIAFLVAAGIDAAHIARESDRIMGLYTIATDAKGERSFSYWRGASAARRLADDPERITRAFAASEVVYLSGITLAILPPAGRAALLAMLGAPGSRRFKVAFDPNIRLRLWDDAAMMRGAITAAARAADIVLPTHDDEAAAFGDADAAATLARYRSLGCAEVVVKDGARPARWAAGGREGTAPVARPVTPIDTTGAGDSFNGAYLAARRSGLGLEAAIARAQRVAAQVIQTRGALLDPAARRAAASGDGRI